VRALHGTQEDYLRALHERFGDLDLSGLDVVLDCAHGATYRSAPEIFRRVGATVTVVFPDPAAVAAIGANPLDPQTRVPAATAGRAQGRAGLGPAR